MKKILLEGAEAFKHFRNPLTLHETRQDACARVQLAPPGSEELPARAGGGAGLACRAVSSGASWVFSGQGHRGGCPRGPAQLQRIGSVPAGASSPLLFSEPQSTQSLQNCWKPELVCNTACGLERWGKVYG